ncbi:MAG: hypothetical protein ACR2GJ_09045 [Gemmatimonadaceae bacterium]
MQENIILVQVTLQALSSVAIAGGLLYAAIQFRSTRKAQLVANFSKLVELQYHLRHLRVQDPSLAKVHPQDIKNLHSDREIQEYFLNMMQLSLFEIAWYAHDQKQLSDEYYDSWVQRMRQVAREESFQKMISNPSVKIMHDDFEAYVKGLAASASAGAPPH